MSEEGSRTGGLLLIGGALLLLLGTILHPMGADPNDSVAAFAEYAGDRLWIASHLGQLLGVLLIAAGLIVLSGQLGQRKRDALPNLAAGGAILMAAVATFLQAVDGIALIRVVDAWDGASAEEQARALWSAYAVRQVEIGGAAVFALVSGLTFVLFGVGLLRSSRFPSWLGWLAVVGGAGSVAGGVATAYTGFSSLAMSLTMPSGAVLLMWMLAVGFLPFRRGAAFAGHQRLH